MTEIIFHFNVADRTGYACRVVRKALRHGSAIVVTGPQPLLAALDRELWTLGATDFLPHAWAADSGAVPASLHARTAWLAAEPLTAPVHDALVNLGDEPPPGFESFTRLIEVVSTAEADRAAARQRWKSYAHRGYPVAGHEAPP
jgi:DNA polymerase-3 subunit chi